jgi:KaiC/GvpD/RAD55 family RecA-like ATPase
MINKILTGIDFIDKELGGLYQNRTYLVTGKDAPGKKSFFSRFLIRGLEKGEVCVLVTGGHPDNYLIEIQDIFGVNVSQYLRTGLFRILQYETSASERQHNEFSRFVGELEMLAREKGVSRFVIDTLHVLEIENDRKKCESSADVLVKALEKAHTTTMLAPEPAATPLTSHIERRLMKICAGTLRLSDEVSQETRKLFYNVSIDGIIGHHPPFPAWDFEVVRGRGLVPVINRKKIFYFNIGTSQ